MACRVGGPNLVANSAGFEIYKSVLRKSTVSYSTQVVYLADSNTNAISISMVRIAFSRQRSRTSRSILRRRRWHSGAKPCDRCPPPPAAPPGKPPTSSPPRPPRPPSVSHAPSAPKICLPSPSRFRGASQTSASPHRSTALPAAAPQRRRRQRCGRSSRRRRANGSSPAPTRSAAGCLGAVGRAGWV